MPITPQLLQETNSKLHRLLDLMHQQESGPLQVSATDLAGLLAELQKVGEFRKTKTKHAANLCAELSEYRKVLENLRAMLPRLQARYLAEKARLERDRNHIRNASGWARSQDMLRRSKH